MKLLSSIENRSMTTAPFTTSFKSSKGRSFTFRPLVESDGNKLGTYLESLSPLTKILFAPHKLSISYACELCSQLDHQELLRMVAIDEDDLGRPIVSYMLLKWGVNKGEVSRYVDYGITLNENLDVTIAPSISDEYQDQGLGSICFSKIIEIAKVCEREKMVLWSGVPDDNYRAVHFYKKFGFTTEGEFKTKKYLKLDMILELTGSGE